MEKDIKVLVVDDTVLDRLILSKILAGISGVDLAGTATNGKIALSKIRMMEPDLVLLDLFMPEMDGMETLREIKKHHPNTDVVMISGIDPENAGETVKALEYGALDFISKPKTDSPEKSGAELKNSLSRLVAMARTRKYSRRARGIGNEPVPAVPPPPKAPLKAPPKAPREKAAPSLFIPPAPRKRGERFIPTGRPIPRIEAVVIGVSTGGPNALQELIPAFPGNFPVPIITVQHMPPMFTATLAARLNSTSALQVVEAGDEERVEPGVMYIAPGGRHLVLRKDRFGAPVTALTDTLPVNSCRPSADVLFRSAAMIFGGNLLVVVLTGMGNDGMSGVGAIRRKGGYSIVQDEKTSIIWGMPGAVVDAGQADEMFPLPKMAERITEIVSARKR